MLNLRAHWLPGMYFDDDPTEYPERIGYDTGPLRGPSDTALT
jgi:hypothetical protein